MRVLIAEDCPTTQRLLTAMIERWGYETLVTSDGTEAYNALLLEEDIELAVVDWEMPGMDGPELCRALDRASRHVYCILLTGREGVESMAEALEAGASDYVCKPCCPTELRARIRSGERLLGLQKRLQSMSTSSEDCTPENAVEGIQELASNLREIQKSYTGVSLVMGEVRQLLECVESGEGAKEAAERVTSAMAEYGLSENEGDVPRIIVETQRVVRSMSERLYILQEASSPSETAEDAEAADGPGPDEANEPDKPEELKQAS